MAHRSNLSTCLVATACLMTASCSSGGNVSNASPRITEVPQQSIAGGSTFSLDLSTYVTDREGASLTYAVVSGGGSFAGSTYSNLFDTMGEYDVVFSVSDGSKTETATFGVRVTSADFAVATEDAQGLVLVDADTGALVRVTAGSQSPAFVTALTQGRMVYRQGGVHQLWVFDAFTRRSTQLGEAPTTYRGKTSDGKVVFTTGETSANDQRLYIHNPSTGVTRDVAQNVLSTFTALVNDEDLVFYEDGVDGQADLYFYDPSEDEVVVVGNAATDEQLQAVLDDGACVFSRVGDGGEHDLYYYRVGTGLVEIGADVTALANRNKTYWSQGTGGLVVFTALNGTDEELWFWNPANGQTTSVAASVDTEVVGVGAGNEIVYCVVVSGTEKDAFFYDMDDGTNATLRDSTDISNVSAIVDGGSVRWAIIRGSGALSTKLAVSLVGTPSTQPWAAGGTVVNAAVLENGDVVARRDDGTALNVFDASAGTWGTPITGTGLTVKGAGIDDGDFVYELQVGGQTDVSMWDASATTVVVVSDAAEEDRFEVRTEGGKVVFGRQVGTNTTWDLFAWDGTSATQLTDVDGEGVARDYDVVNKFAASR